jgi:hypothetical protein
VQSDHPSTGSSSRFSYSQVVFLYDISYFRLHTLSIDTELLTRMRFSYTALALLGINNILNVVGKGVDLKPQPKDVFESFTKAGYRDGNCTLENVTVRREWY